ncbi:MAG: CBS domain-containing protein [Syntrophobacteraceae bacterium]|nr:CBS domain-containing protein [Syntrophobacteraceae bacterium]
MAEKVMHLMRRGAITCAEDTTIQEVAQIMVVNSIRYCVVINGRNEVQGIISARSILKAYGRNLNATRAKDILLPYTVTITPSSSLNEAVELMSKKRIEHLIVVSDRPGSKAILGLLHAEDIVNRMAMA